MGFCRSRRGIPLACGLVAAVLTAVTFGGLKTPPGWHDEAAYLLQAKLFAHGTWVAPSPRLPEFFAQFHVLVVPKLAAKYPPGQALFLVPGVVLGLPGLMIVIAAGVTAALLFMLVQARWGQTAGLGAVLLWVLCPMALYWRSSYVSEVTSGMFWLVGLLLAATWWEIGGLKAATALGVVVGAMAITRPLTALAFAAPLCLPCMVRTIRKHRVREGVAAVLATIALLLVLPAWALHTTGNASRSPLSLYTAQYMPWDRLGFGLNTASPDRVGPPDMARWAEDFRALHAQYTPRAAVRAIAKRVAFVVRDAFGRWWLLFALLAVLGCVALGTAGALVTAQAGTLVVLYGLYAHFVTWDVYYFELVAPACGCAAIGLAFLTRALARRRAWTPQWRRGMQLGASAVLGALLLAELPAAVVQSLARHDRQRQFLRSMAGIHEPAIVFVRYGETHDVDAQLVGLLGAPGRTWVVHDLGARNACLAAQEPRRATFHYDEDASRLVPVTLRTDPASLSEVGCP